MTRAGIVTMVCAAIMLIAGVALLARTGSQQAWVSIAGAGVLFAIAAAVGRKRDGGPTN